MEQYEKDDVEIELTEEQVDEVQEAERIDWEAEAKKNKAIADRLSKKLEKKDDKPAQKDTNTELIEDTFFTSKGIEDDTIRDEVRKMAQRSGMSLSQALKDDFIKERVAHLQKQDELKALTPRPSGTSAGTVRDLQWHIDTGTKPTDPKDKAKWLKEIAKRG